MADTNKKHRHKYGIRLIASDINHIFQYQGFCKISINHVQSMLFVEPINEEFKLISIMLKWKFYNQKNILFVFAENVSQDFVLVFNNESKCKRVYDLIYQKRANDAIANGELYQRILTPMLKQIIENKLANAAITETLLKWINALDGQDKESYIQMMKDANICHMIFTNGECVGENRLNDETDIQGQRKRKFSEINTNDNPDGESLCSVKRTWKKCSNSSNAKNTTISLHISTYENSVKAIAPDSVGDSKDDGFKIKKSDTNKQHFPGSTNQNPYEFPRQQEGGRTADPEVMGFRASQRLRNPNQGSSSSYQSEPDTKEHIRHYMKIIFDKNPDVTAEEMEKEIEKTYPLDAPSTRTCYRWIKEFKSGEQTVKLKDHGRSGRPGKFDETELHDFVLANPNMTVKMFAEHFGCATGTISNHLKKLDIVHKFGRWIPHRLTPGNISRRLEVCTDLLNRYNHGELNLDKILTTDEKWVVYDNVVRRRQWIERGSLPLPTPRPEIHQKKLMLCFFWDTEGPVHFEFVPHGHTVDQYYYRRMLDRVQEAIIEKRGAGREVFFLQDNAPAHRAIITKEKIDQLGWTLLPHPPYSPCLSPSDYHAFLSLSNWLQGKIFENDDQLRQSIQEWIDEKPSGFWVHGFTKLPQRWQKCIDAHGNYFEDD